MDINFDDYEEFIEWKLIVINGIATHYMISSTGEVKNIKTNEILIPTLNTNKYFRVAIFVNGVSYKKYIHRLVAKAFIPNPENKPQVNHINGIKTDNRVENLEWVTAQENTIHAFKSGLAHAHKNRKRGSSHKLSKYTENQIHKVCKLLEIGTPNTIIFLLTGVKSKYVSRIRTKRCWTHISDLYNIDIKNRAKYIRGKVLKTDYDIEL